MMLTTIASKIELISMMDKTNNELFFKFAIVQLNLQFVVTLFLLLFS